MKTFYEVWQLYLKYNQSNKQTKNTYSNILTHHWYMFKELPIDEITVHMVLEELYNKDLSDKYINQILIPLRGVFNLAVMFEYITKNPIDNIKNRKIQHELPDPFTKEEMDKILNYLKVHSSKNCYLFYELSFWTGLRPSEVLALTANDITDKGLYIHKSRVQGYEKKVTKTKVSRLVLFNDRSLHIINQLPKSGYLFTVPDTLRPYRDNAHFRYYFKQALLDREIRLRPSYNTRHTYATLLLMNGVNPMFVANQLGHSLVMLTNRYARWINSNQDKLELDKIKNLL